MPSLRPVEEGAAIFLNRCDGFTHEARVVAREFVRPKIADERIFDLPDDPRAIVGVGEHAIHAEQGSVLTVEQGDEGVVVVGVGHRHPGAGHVSLQLVPAGEHAGS